MKIPEIKSQLKKLAKEFDLQYKDEWFKYLWISKRENTLIEYLWMCPDPIYTQYGKTLHERTKNIDKFVNSKEFQEIIKRFGGQVMKKKELTQGVKIVRNIENKNLMKEIQNLIKKIKNKIKSSTSLALLTETKIKKEQEYLKKRILLHEWIHIILFKNNIRFQKINKKDWKNDEGLCTFCEEFVNNNLDKLESKAKKITYPMEHQYYIYAIKFRNLLKNASTPKERKQIILKKLRELK